MRPLMPVPTLRTLSSTRRMILKDLLRLLIEASVPRQ